MDERSQLAVAVDVSDFLSEDEVLEISTLNISNLADRRRESLAKRRRLEDHLEAKRIREELGELFFYEE